MLQRKITFYAFIGLLVCSVLLPPIAPFFVLVLCLVWFWEGDFKNKTMQVTKHRFFWILPVYYILLLLSMQFVDEVKSSLEQLEVASILLVLPLLLPSLKSLNFTYYKRTFKRVLVGTIFVAFAVCLFRAGYFYSQAYLDAQRGLNSGVESGLSNFLGSSFCGFFMPPDHLVFYINLAILLLLFDLKKTLSQRKIYLSIFSVLLLLIFVALLNSKIGFVMLICVLALFAARMLRITGKTGRV